MGRGEPFFDDGVYVVWVRSYVERRKYGSRERWEIEAYYRGDRASTQTRLRVGSEAHAMMAAEDFRRDYQAGLHTRPEKVPFTLGELVERFCTRTTGRKDRRLSPKTERAYRSQLQALVAVAGEDRPLRMFSHHHVKGAIDRVDNPASKAAYLRAMQAMVRWAVGKGWLALDITAPVETASPPKRLRPFLRPDQHAPFLAAASPSMTIRAGLILETGIRRAEANNLRESWIIEGLAGWFISIPGEDTHGWSTKSWKARAIPLSDEAVRLVRQAREMWPRGEFILHEGKAPLGAMGNWNRDVKRAARLANARASEEAGKPVEAVPPGIDVHGLRRSFAVRLLAAGAAMHEVQKLLGHESVTTTEKHYAGIVEQSLIGAIGRLNADAGVRAAGASGASPHTYPPKTKGAADEG